MEIKTIPLVFCYLYLTKQKICPFKNHFSRHRMCICLRYAVLIVQWQKTPTFLLLWRNVFTEELMLRNSFKNVLILLRISKGIKEGRTTTRLNRRYMKDSTEGGPCRSEFWDQFFFIGPHWVEGLKSQIFLKSVQPFLRYGQFWILA